MISKASNISQSVLKDLFSYDGIDYENVRFLPWSEFRNIEGMVPFLQGAMVGVRCGGTLRMTIDGEQYNIGVNNMFVLQNDSVVTRVKPSKACWGYAVLFKGRFLADKDVAPEDFLAADMKAHTLRVVEVEPSLAERMNTVVAEMVKVAKNPDIRFRVGAVTSLTAAFFYLSLSTVKYDQESVEAVPESDKAKYYMTRFVELLSIEHSRERRVEYYASRLGISPKYLSLVCYKFRGKTASRVIDDVVLYNAKQLLKQQGVSIKQVSDQLNFPSQSFFGKYFKQRVGISPSRYKGMGK